MLRKPSTSVRITRKSKPQQCQVICGGGVNAVCIQLILSVKVWAFSGYYQAYQTGYYQHADVVDGKAATFQYSACELIKWSSPPLLLCILQKGTPVLSATLTRTTSKPYQAVLCAPGTLQQVLAFPYLLGCMSVWLCVSVRCSSTHRVQDGSPSKWSVDVLALSFLPFSRATCDLSS